MTARAAWTPPADTVSGAALDRLRQLLDAAAAADGLDTLAARARVPARSLYRVLHESARCVTLTLADRLVTHGLGDPGLWHTDAALSEWYERSPK